MPFSELGAHDLYRTYSTDISVAVTRAEATTTQLNDCTSTRTEKAVDSTTSTYSLILFYTCIYCRQLGQ